MKKQNRLKLAYISILAGWFLAGFLFRFLFGARIYTEWEWRYLLPHRIIPGPIGLGYYGDMTLDAVVYALVLYVLFYTALSCFNRFFR